MTRVYFVRHAQPEHAYADDRTRPLTAEGAAYAELVWQVLQDKGIDAFYCSPYKRSIDTVRETAERLGKELRLDEWLRERQSGPGGNGREMFRRRWNDHAWHEDGGESIGMVQARNIEALRQILSDNEGKTVAVGTHGTALSAIINYYRPEFGCDDFLRIIDWMPYIVELDFDGQRFLSMTEHGHVEKLFKPV